MQFGNLIRDSRLNVLSLISESNIEANYIKQDQETHAVGAAAYWSPGYVHSGGTEVLWDKIGRPLRGRG